MGTMPIETIVVFWLTHTNKTRYTHLDDFLGTLLSFLGFFLDPGAQGVIDCTRENPGKQKVH